jgi:hypothetical protein
MTQRYETTGWEKHPENDRPLGNPEAKFCLSDRASEKFQLVNLADMGGTTLTIGKGVETRGIRTRTPFPMVRACHPI